MVERMEGVDYLDPKEQDIDTALLEQKQELGDLEEDVYDGEDVESLLPVRQGETTINIDDIPPHKLQETVLRDMQHAGLELSDKDQRLTGKILVALKNRYPDGFDKGSVIKWSVDENQNLMIQCYSKELKDRKTIRTPLNSKPDQKNENENE